MRAWHFRWGCFAIHRGHYVELFAGRWWMGFYLPREALIRRRLLWVKRTFI